MSISDSEIGGAPFDSAVIARFANELFAALPGWSAAAPPGVGVASAPPATPPVEVGALPVAPTIPPSSSVGMLTGTEPRSLPATVSGATIRPPQAGFTPSAALGPYDFRPALIPDEGFPAPPDDDIVSASSTPPPVKTGTLSVEPALPFAPPTEAELRALPASLADASTQPPQPAAAPSALGSPGSSYYFLDATPPPAPPTLPPGDYDFHPAILPDLGILAGPYDPRLAGSTGFAGLSGR